jgi:actin-related protein
MLVWLTIARAPVSVQPELWRNVILAGGNSLFPGLQARLQYTLQRLAPSGTCVRVNASPTRKHLAWKGGALASLLPNFQETLVTKQVFEERGPDALDRW